MDTRAQNPIAKMGGEYLGNGERIKDENFNKSSPNLQIKPDPYLSGEQLWILESKKNQSNNIQENDPNGSFYKGSKKFEQNQSQSHINNNNISNNNNMALIRDPYLSGEQLWILESKKNQSNNIQENDPNGPFYKGFKKFEQNPSQSHINNNNISNNNKMAFINDQNKQLVVQENNLQISINNEIRSINVSMNNQNQLMNQIQQQIYKLSLEQDSMKNQIGQINQLLLQQKQFFETQMMTLTSSIQQLILKNNIINNANQINNIKNNNQIPNFNDDNRNAFNNNNNYIVKFKDSQGTFDVEFKEDESIFLVMRKYRKKSNNLSNKKFVFNGRELDPNLSCKNANLTNNSIIEVYDL